MVVEGGREVKGGGGGAREFVGFGAIFPALSGLLPPCPRGAYWHGDIVVARKKDNVVFRGSFVKENGRTNMMEQKTNMRNEQENKPNPSHLI